MEQEIMILPRPSKPGGIVGSLSQVSELGSSGVASSSGAASVFLDYVVLFSFYVEGRPPLFGARISRRRWFFGRLGVVRPRFRVLVLLSAHRFLMVYPRREIFRDFLTWVWVFQQGLQRGV